MSTRGGYRGNAQPNDWIGHEHYEKLDRFHAFMTQQRDARNNRSEPVTVRIGPSHIAPPRVPEQYADAFEGSMEGATEEDTIEAHTLAIQNERLSNCIRDLGHAPHLPSMICETAAQVFIQGYEHASQILEVQERSSWKPVHIRDCRSSSQQLVFHVKGFTTTLIIDDCERIRIVADTVVKRVVLLCCKDVEVVIVDRPPPILAFGCSNCTVAVSKDAVGTQIESVGCTGMQVAWVFETINDFAQLRHLELYRDLFETPKAKTTAQTLPEVLKVRVNHTSLTCWHAPAAPANLGRPLPVSGVGMTLQKDEFGYKVRRLDRVAMIYGSVEMGDYLLMVEGRDVTKMSLAQVTALLVGRNGTETEVTIGRFMDVNVVQTYNCRITHWHSAPNRANINCATSFYTAPDAHEMLPANMAGSVQQAEQRSSAKVGDIGMEFHLDEDGKFRVHSCLEGSPAADCGKVKQGDVVFGINSNHLMDVTEAVARRMTQGAEGSEVTVTLVDEEGGGEGHRHVTLQRRTGALGLKVRQAPRGLWVVDALVEGGPADTSGRCQVPPRQGEQRDADWGGWHRLRNGDVVHSIDGVAVAGKSSAEFQALSQGPIGSQALVAVLTPAARPHDPWLELHAFGHWRAVMLIRTSAPPPPLALTPVPRSDAVLYRSAAEPLSPRSSTPQPPASRSASEAEAAGWFGVGLEVEERGEEATAVYVSGVEVDGEAELSGVEEGDQVVSLDGQPVPGLLGAPQVRRLLLGPAGSRLMLGTLRAGAKEGEGLVAREVLLLRGVGVEEEFVRTRAEKAALLNRALHALRLTQPRPLVMVGRSRRVVLRAERFEALGMHLAAVPGTGQAWVCALTGAGGDAEGGAALALRRVLVGDVVEAVEEAAAWRGMTVAHTVHAIDAALRARRRVSLLLRWSLLYRPPPLPAPPSVESFLLRTSRQRTVELQRRKGAEGWWGSGVTLQAMGEEAVVSAVAADSEAARALQPGDLVLAVNGLPLRDRGAIPLSEALLTPLSPILLFSVIPSKVAS